MNPFDVKREGEPVGRPAELAAPARTSRPGFARRLLRRPTARICLGYLAVVVLVAILAPVFLPDVAGQNAGDLLGVLKGPSLSHLLGTDSLGRDVLERILVGTRITITGVAEVLLVVAVIGLPAGLLAGYRGGWVDRIVGWLADLAFSVPAIVVVLLVLSIYAQNMTAAMVTFGVLASPALMRVVRSAVLPVRQELYISAAVVAGLPPAAIVVRHVLPRVRGVVVVQLALISAEALLVQTSLAFLGLVAPAPAPSWGGMVADGASSIALQPWLIVPAGLVIAITVLAFGLLGDAVRDAVNETWSSAPATQPRRRAAASRKQSAASPSGSPAVPGQALLAVSKLKVSLKAGSALVLDDVSFEINPGETVGLVGESGCGKTMTAMSVLGLLPPGARVESGHVMFEGRDLDGLSERELNHVRGSGIGFVSQEPMIGLNPAFRVGTQIAQAVRHHHEVSRKQAKAQAVDLLQQVGLPGPEQVARRYPHEISGGMAQRVAIARALAGDPRLLIADEPTTALDVTVQADILDLLRSVQQRRNMAVLLVSHDWGVIADAADRIVVMYAGQVVEQAPADLVFEAPLHPYSAALLASDLHNTESTGPLPSIPGAVPLPGMWPAGCHFRPRCQHAQEDCTPMPVPLTEWKPGHQTRCLHADRLARQDD
jgi:peptide/nickel transport system permease protein